MLDPKIEQSHTLPSDFYKNPDLYRAGIERFFAASWQFIESSEYLEQYNCFPFQFAQGSVDEPLLLTKDNEGKIHCLSNVCTHRGKILVEKPQKTPLISCGYHGRCFKLDGSFRSMPEFKEALDFPSPADHLPRLPLAHLGRFLFAALPDAAPDFEQVFRPIIEEMHWFPFDKLRACPQADQTYEINAHWALYCDNYLEGFHVPFVHPALNERLVYQDYTTKTYEYANVQIGVASGDAAYFDLPSSSPEYGQRIHAYYWWVFPNLMINIYTWGVSINVVLPMGIDKTKIVFKTYLLPDKNEADFLTSTIDQTEMEDEAVVESVQKGIQSRLYKQGRFSPTMERGVHHFHCLVNRMLLGS